MIRWHKQRSPFYHNTETDSHTLKGVVRRFGFSLSWLRSLVPRPQLIRYVVWQYAARFLGKMEVIGHVTSAH